MSDIDIKPEEDSRLDIQEEGYKNEVCDSATRHMRPAVLTTAQDLDKMKARLAAIEEESARLAKMENEHEQSTNPSFAGAPSGRERREDIDARSIFVGNVDYGASPEEIQDHFKSCGSINRVTILLDKHTGHPKGSVIL
jgi:RNA recognition motif-containing protein